MKNKVVKVITDKDPIIFIVEFEDGFFALEVPVNDWRGYWEKKAKQDTNLFSDALNFTPATCNAFVNDMDADDIGSSVGGFDTLEEVFKEYNIL